MGRLYGLDFITFGTQANTEQAEQSRVVVDKQDFPLALGWFGRHTGKVRGLCQVRQAASYSCSLIERSIEVIASSFSSASANSLRSRRFSASIAAMRWLVTCCSVRAALDVDS